MSKNESSKIQQVYLEGEEEGEENIEIEDIEMDLLDDEDEDFKDFLNRKETIASNFRKLSVAKF
jgi:hypothetical protein